MLRIEGVSKRYGERAALRDVSLLAAPGVLGLLGPNGAGKSTLLRILATVERPDAGRVAFGELDVLDAPASLRAHLGYLPQDLGLWPEATVDEVLELFARVKGIAAAADRRAEIDWALEVANLEVARRLRVSRLSGGMRQRLGLAQALLARPRLLLLDEPSAGLDPEERQRLHAVVAQLASEATVVMATHLVSDVAAACDEIAVLDGGRLVAATTPDAAVASMRGRVWELTVTAVRARDLRAGHRLLEARRADGGVRVRLLADEAPPGAEAAAPRLEDFYFAALEAA